MNHYLEEMEHYDKDNRYMGASDLCNLICSEGNSLDQDRERKCIQAFIKQLDDKSTEVQGKAVQCLAKIASKIKEDNLGNILKKVATCIVEGEKDFRDIYSICCKSIMAEITDTYAPTVIKAVYPILQTGIKSKDEEVQEECVELLSEMMKRFAPNIIHEPSLIKEKAVLDQLFKLLQGSAPYTLKKKVAYCLGCISVILSSSNISALMDGLVGFINDNMKNEDKLFYYILSLSWVSRKIGYKLGGYLESLIINLIKICDNLDTDNSNDQLNEIAEESLNCLESLIKHCPREISPYIEKLLEVAQDRMTYDPIYDYDVEEDMDVDDDGEGWDDDEFDDDEVQDDDSSWKVRRGSLNLIISVITTRPEMLRKLYSNLSQRLVERFKERENKIKALVFNAFAVLLKTTNVKAFDSETLAEAGISMPEMMKQRSSTEELFGQVPAIVKSLIKETSNKNVGVKIAILECLAQITNALRDQLNPFFIEIVPISKNPSSMNRTLQSLSQH
jgi:cullin-associated NEDD8-dissociated protein 1